MRATAIALALLFTLDAHAQQAPASGAPVPAADDSMRRELDELRAKQRELERRLEASEARFRPTDKTEKFDSPSPRFSYGREGFVFGTADGKNELRLHAVLNVDGRAYVGGMQPDTFLLRRARLCFDGTLFGIVDFRIMPDFAANPILLDAFVELHPWRWLRLRGGRFRSPFGLEFLQSDTTLMFAERSLATDLVPLRDVGVMLNGDVAGGTFSYAIAMVNGAPDGGNGPDLDPQSEKDYVGRLFFRPLRPFWRAALVSELGFGVSASYGRVKGTAAATNLPTYHSTTQQPVIFSYLAGMATPDAAAIAMGDRWRVSPQLYWYIGPVGLLAEYVFSSQRVQRTGVSADLQHQAWNVTLSFVLTLERAAYEGVVPRHPIDFKHKAFGAFELVVRYSELRLDPQAFPIFADPAASVHSARELAAGLNWHLTEYLKLMLSYHRTDYSGGAATGDREPENGIMGRLQFAL